MLTDLDLLVKSKEVLKSGQVLKKVPATVTSDQRQSESL